MDQPVTRQEHEELKKRVEKIERQTEPIPTTTRIEVASADVLNQLKALEQGQQEISQKQKEEFASIEKRQAEQDKGLFMHSQHISALHEEVKGARADIANIQATQSDHGELLKNTATKENLTALKEDLTALKNEHGQKLDEHSRKLDEQNEMLRQILRIVGQKPSE